MNFTNISNLFIADKQKEQIISIFLQSYNLHVVNLCYYKYLEFNRFYLVKRRFSNAFAGKIAYFFIKQNNNASHCHLS